MVFMTDNDRSIIDVLDGRGLLRGQDLEEALRLLDSKEQSPSQVADKKVNMIYQLVVKRDRKLDDIRYILEASKYFEKKGNYLHAAELIGKMGNKDKAREIYKIGAEYYREKGMAAEALEAAIGAKLSTSEIRKKYTDKIENNANLIKMYMDYADRYPKAS